jgi:hypothetical protein
VETELGFYSLQHTEQHTAYHLRHVQHVQQTDFTFHGPSAYRPAQSMSLRHVQHVQHVQQTEPYLHSPSM